MLPEAFRNRIKTQQYINADELFQALAKQSPVSIRINKHKWTYSPAGSDPVPWCQSGFYLNKRPSYTPDPLFHAGCYYPQEASSMFLEQIFLQMAGVKPDLRVLDLCGAPGGKSTHISSLIGDKGFLVSNEVIRQRASVLAENLTKWGLSNSVVTQSDPASFSRLPGFFDVILVDAPCSGEGMFRDEVARNEWSEENTDHCSVRQKRILMDVWPSLKENGFLIYSTCTFNPQENEQNIKWFLTKNEAEVVRLDISDFEGITEIDYEGIYGYGFHPGKIRGEGLFVAVIRKKGSVRGSSARPNKGNDQKISPEEKKYVAEWTGFQNERIVKWGDNIIALPCSYDEMKLLSDILKIVNKGTTVFTVKKKNYLPSHEIALSVRLKKNQFPSVDLDLADALSYLRRDNFKAPFPEKGWNLVTYKGVNLGFVNNIGTRYNNYYPVEWRIRMILSEDAMESTIKWIRTDK